jgi:hypothetical protein
LDDRTAEAHGVGLEGGLPGQILQQQVDRWLQIAWGAVLQAPTPIVKDV